jgi:hypothetical protein
MKNVVILLAVLGLMVECSRADEQARIQPILGPVLHGTINVVIANDNGMVVLTDSMITATRRDAHGSLVSAQLSTPGQKLFRIDDESVCSFAGFASADTTPLPDFLNSVSGIMARVPVQLSRFKLPFSQKLDVLEGLFTYYLTGVANLRHSDTGTFELLLAGFDLDGSPKVGRLILGTTSEHNSEFLRSVTLERHVFSIAPQTMGIFLNGKRELAGQILMNPERWKANAAIADFENATQKHEAMTIEQMQALAVALKEETAKQDNEVGGPNQIAVLRNHKVQSLEQPQFPAVVLPPYEFRIFSTFTFDESGAQDKRRRQAIGFDGFAVMVVNTFIHVNQPLDNAYFANNTFRDCALYYGGGRLLFMDSNTITDTDLFLSPTASRDSSVVQDLLKNFKWKSVQVGTLENSTPAIRWR